MWNKNQQNRPNQRLEARNYFMKSDSILTLAYVWVYIWAKYVKNHQLILMKPSEMKQSYNWLISEISVKKVLQQLGKHSKHKYGYNSDYLILS